METCFNAGFNQHLQVHAGSKRPELRIQAWKGRVARHRCRPSPTRRLEQSLSLDTVIGSELYRHRLSRPSFFKHATFQRHEHFKEWLEQLGISAESGLEGHGLDQVRLVV